MRKQHHQQSVTQQHHTPPKVQLDMDFHTLQKYTLEETTGTEKAQTGRESTSSHAQHFTHQSRHMTGQTSSDSHHGDRHRQTKLQIVGGERNIRLVEDEWTTQPAKTSNKPWTGWTNFEEHQEFPTQLESDDEEQQQGTKAKAVQAPKQPTPQEIREHNVTPSLQDLVSNKRTSKRQTTQSPKATQQASKLHQRLC